MYTDLRERGCKDVNWAELASPASELTWRCTVIVILIRSSLKHAENTYGPHIRLMFRKRGGGRRDHEEHSAPDVTSLFVGCHTN